MKNIQKISAENSDNYDFNYQNLDQNIQQDWQTI